MKTGARTRRHTDQRLGAALALAVPLCVCAPVRPLLAQENPTIKAAIQLAASGQGDSARSLVARELARTKRGDSTYVEALYWSGRLAVTGESAESDLRRVAIEYSNSRWADQALLQLSELALAAGNGAGALQLAERLRNEYPTSALRAAAALWGGRAAFELGDPATACAMLDSARAEAPGDVEFLNQVAFYQPRCAALAARRRADTSHAAPAKGAAPPPAAAAETTHAAPAAPAVPYEVQVGATHSSRTARSILTRAERAGEHARIVTGSDGLRRVRAGPYATEAAAEAAAARLKRKLGGHPFVVQGP
jgi:SPOR domain/Tetratricopeptide repeat